MGRLSLEQALAHVIALAPRTAAEPRTLEQLVGHVLAEDLDFPGDLPPFDNASMDGYALMGAHSAGARLPVRGESRAGEPHAEGSRDGGDDESGPCARVISTGAVMPSGFDTVVPWEDVTRDEATVTLLRDAHAGQHVRRRGDDARAHNRALCAGIRLSARHLALLAALERTQALVHRAPRMSLLVTGDELRAPGAPRTAGSIVDTNTPMLTALAAHAGAQVAHVHVPDHREAHITAIGRARDESDVIVTVGGAADGKHDHVLAALDALGARLVFRGVSIKPGKPVALARLGDTPVLVLPGNPGSAYVTFALFGAPLLRAMQDETAAVPRWRRATLTERLRAPADRDALAYGVLQAGHDTDTFVPSPPATSGSVPGVAGASAIARVPSGATLEAGSAVSVLDLDVG